MTGLLHTVLDWQLQVYLGRQLTFPEHITRTSLRPDVIINSKASKHLNMLELTVPSEVPKYQKLVEACRDRGWRAFYEAIEDRCRGFVGRLFCKVLMWLGSSGVAKRRTIQSVTEAIEKATWWLWIKRVNPWVAAELQVRA